MLTRTTRGEKELVLLRRSARFRVVRHSRVANKKWVTRLSADNPGEQKKDVQKKFPRWESNLRGFLNNPESTVVPLMAYPTPLRHSEVRLVSTAEHLHS
jgi:hypothetical protein